MIGPVLGIETSCDETSAAVTSAEGGILGLVIHSQEVHRLYGGVVPELAARDHLRRIERVVAAALQDAKTKRAELRAVAATVGPGLIGALLVGASWGRAAAFALGVPFVPVHHMEAHLFGPVLEDPEAVPPFVALLVSGGHTLLLWVPEWGKYFLLGETRDDAVGEAFDKVGRLLGLPYPGGPAIEKAALAGDAHRYDFPRPLLGKRQNHPRATNNSSRGRPPDLDFSFSGLKTAVARTVQQFDSASLAGELPHLAASFQEAAVDILARRSMAAVRAVNCPRLLLGGGVSANRALQERLWRDLGPAGRLFVGSPRVSLDNAAMVARAGQFRLESGDFGGLSDAVARVTIPSLLPWNSDLAQNSYSPEFSVQKG